MLRIDAAAKVNLTLAVTGRRDDGYHLIDSLVVFAGASDALEIAPAGRFALEVGGPFAAAAGPDRDNLIHAAAHRLAALLDRAPAVRIALTKNLPAAAGIGGGSADAAAALRGLAALWANEPDRCRLDDLALAVGADVPVCLYGRPAYVSGIGEIVSPAPPLPEAHLVLVTPGEGVSAARVYAGHARSSRPFSPPLPPLDPPLDVRAFAAWLSASGNDLTDAACAAVPSIAGVLAALAAAGCLLARMSGSGPTCFGLFESAAAARRAARSISAREPGWWVRAAAILTEPPPVVRPPVPGAAGAVAGGGGGS